MKMVAGAGIAPGIIAGYEPAALLFKLSRKEIIS